MTDAKITYFADRGFVRAVGQAALGGGSRFQRSVAGVVVLTAFGVYAVTRDRLWLGVASFVLAALALFAVVTVLKHRRRIEDSVRAQYAGLPEPVRIDIHVDDEGMHFSNAATSQLLPWAEVGRVREGRRVWFVETTTRMSLPIPASAIGADAVALIRARTRERPASDAR